MLTRSRILLEKFDVFIKNLIKLQCMNFLQVGLQEHLCDGCYLFHVP